MSKTINIKTGEHYDVLIDRRTKWGNPFRIGKDGTREQVIEKYRQWIIKSPQLMQDIAQLRDKVLGCWCKPLPCHGDVLVELARTHETKGSRNESS